MNRTLIISKQQEQMLLGSLLGDGSIFYNKDSNSYNYIEKHCIKQKDYLLWKNATLKFNFGEIINKHNHQYIINKSNAIFKSYRELFYPNGKKIVTKEILDKLESLGLAIWFMDDGCYRYSNKNILILTQAFGLEGNQIIQECFKKRWDIDCKISKDSKKDNAEKSSNLHYYINFNTNNTRNFIDIVKPYILSSMNYKIGLDQERIERQRVFYNRNRINRGPGSYYSKNRERALQRSKEYRLNNLDKMNNYLKKWREEHPNYRRDYYLKNKYKKNNISSPNILKIEIPNTNGNIEKDFEEDIRI